MNRKTNTDISNGYYDGIPIVPKYIKEMTQEELDKEWNKIVKKHKKKDAK